MTGPRRESAIPDAGARRVAATEFEANLVVEAGAGTGKTSLLIERVLTAVGSGILEITELAAITFTEKAAGEMRQRLARGLERLRALARGDETGLDEGSEADRAFRYLAGEAGVETGEIARRSLSALEGLDRATVVTIHSFCSELLRTHPLEAGVDPDFVVDSGEIGPTLVEEAWEEFVGQELGPEAPRPKLWRALLERISLNEAAELARALAGFGFPDSLLDAPESWAAPEGLLETTASRMSEEIDVLLDRADGMTRPTREYFEGMAAAFGALRSDGLVAFLVAVRGNPDLADRLERNACPVANKKLEGVSHSAMNRLSRSLLRLARGLAEADDEGIRLLVETLAPFAREFRERYLRRGLVSFDALLVVARDLLRDDLAVRDSLKRRYRMLLVDEFQDTDPLQYEIVLFLAERPGGHSRDPYQADLDPGRLFIVGDPKQSIYRFRGADYTAYRTAVGRVIEQGGTTQELVTNFRSLPGIIKPVNRLFEPGRGSVWSESGHQPRYAAIHAWRDREDDAPRVELWTLELPGKARAEDRRRAEGVAMAEEIEQLVRSGKVRDFGEISILLRAYGSLSFYLRPLRERGIPFVVDGGREFLQRPEVAQLMAVLQALSQPADQTALLAFLRSPAGGVPDTMLAAYAADDGRWDWRADPDPSRHSAIAGRFRLLRELAATTRNLPADAVVRRVVEHTLLLPLSAAAFEGAQRVANLRKLAAGAGELARDGRLSLEEVVEALRQGRLGGVESDSPLADDLARAVRVTSIHRMKGLENRWILVPDLARQRGGGTGDRVEVRLGRTPSGSAVPGVRAGEIHGTAWTWLREENERHEMAEETRVLYVALTRARDHLVLISAPTARSASWLDALAPWGYTSDAPPEDGERLCEGAVLHRRVAASPAGPLRGSATVGVAAEAVEAYTAAVRRLEAAAGSPFERPSDAESRAEEPEHGEARGSSPSREIGAAAGTLIHRLLEKWDGGPAEDLRKRLAALVSAIAEERAVDREALEDEASGILETFLGSPLVELFRDLEIVDRELPLILAGEDGRVSRGIIDLLYRDPTGGLVVADFKTDRESDPQRLGETYTAQLNAYGRAVQLAMDLPAPPRVELWHLRSGSVIPLLLT